MLAMMLWSAVGTGMLLAGLAWSRSVHGLALALFVAAAAGLGLLKARFALSKTAHRVVDRICRRGDAAAWAGFLSWRCGWFVRP